MENVQACNFHCDKVQERQFLVVVEKWRPTDVFGCRRYRRLHEIISLSLQDEPAPLNNQTNLKIYFNFLNILTFNFGFIFAHCEFIIHLDRVCWILQHLSIWLHFCRAISHFCFGYFVTHFHSIFFLFSFCYIFSDTFL